MTVCTAQRTCSRFILCSLTRELLLEILKGNAKKHGREKKDLKLMLHLAVLRLVVCHSCTASRGSQFTL